MKQEAYYIMTCVILIVLFYLNPKLDSLPNGDLVIWFGPKDNRKWIKLNKKP